MVGKPSEDCVDGKIGNAWTSEAYRDDEDGAVPGLCFAGYLLYYLVRGHCFPDGNKRAAWAASMDVLAHIGLTVEASEDEAYDLVIGIAEGKISGGIDVVRWISKRLKAPDL
jgi:death on curing protein